MGHLEESSGKRKKKQDIQKAVLAALAVSGMLTVAAIAPNTLQLLRYLPRAKSLFSYRSRTAASRLVAKKYAAWVEVRGAKYLRITRQGREALAFEQARISLAGAKKKWDGRWRMVVFDIPERRRRVRLRLRVIMRDIGFVRLQDSVWVYPYDCEDFIALLKAELKVGKDVLYAIVDTIEFDKHIRRHFGLREA